MIGDQVKDPGPDVADKILDGLEEFVDPPAEVARKARRLRAHIEALREALATFARGSIDVSGSAVIVGYPEAKAAQEEARRLVPTWRER